MPSLTQVKNIYTLLCLTGVLMSIYALFVEVKKESNEDYEAMCDISEHMSCTRVLSSKWGRGFGVLEHVVGKHSILNQPNSIYGIVFYILLAVLNRGDSPWSCRWLVALSATSNVMSVYLACILFFVLHDFCVVCVTMYAINALLIIIAIYKQRLVATLISKKR